MGSPRSAMTACTPAAVPTKSTPDRRMADFTASGSVCPMVLSTQGPNSDTTAGTGINSARAAIWALAAA